jgi:hypothetical protein
MIVIIRLLGQETFILPCQIIVHVVVTKFSSASGLSGTVHQVLINDSCCRNCIFSGFDRRALTVLGTHLPLQYRSKSK